MKRKLLPLAIGAAVAMPGVALADAPTVYGKLNVTVENYDNDPDGNAFDFDRWEVNSNASRLGVKGKEKISDNLTGVYKAEFEMYVDDGDSGDSKGNDTFEQRNIYVGLEGGFGQVIIGRFDTPTKTAQGKVDQFNDMNLGDIKNVLVGEERTSDTIQYTTPAMGPVTAKLAFMPGEGSCTASTTDCDDGLADAFSASVAFSQDGIYAALATDSDVDGVDVIRLVGQMSIDIFTVGLIYQTAEEADPAAGDPADEQEGFVLSGAVNVGDGKIKVQYGSADNDDITTATTTTTETTQIGLGYEHKLSKRTKVFTHYINLENETGSVTSEQTTLAFGAEHKF
ncbi:MAG: porin [Pseudomonadales bacterium]|nr:porin [Pseudomonadales bacterium]